MREFMDACSDPLIPEVIGIFASQMGKSDSILNVMGQRIHRNPGPMMAIYPTLEIAESFSKDRIGPMVRDTPALQPLVQGARTRDAAQTIRHKTFPGGHLTLAGANSPASLASRPIRDLFCDEIDRYPQSAGTEGNPLKLATTRTVGFWNAKKVYITSPGNKGSSLSEEIWAKSDQRLYYVPCHACGEFQALRWPQVQWNKDLSPDAPRRHFTETARYVCEICGAWWSDAQRWIAVRRGQWRASKPFRGVAGFKLNALAAPWEFRRLSILAEQWVEAQRNPENLRVFWTTVLAEWYEQKFHTLKADVVEARCEPYPRRDDQVVAPWGVAVITAGVDVQNDRIEVQIQGYGAGLEQWKLSYHVLDGDPSAASVWDELWDLLRKPIPMQRGGVDFIRATCVDTGAHSLRTYDFCRSRFVYQPDHRRAYVFAIKGKGGPGNFWPNAPSLKNKGRIPLYTIRVDHAKDILYTSLEKIVTPGAGFIHFPAEVTTGKPFGKRYFDQLTAEKVNDERQPDGTMKRVWTLPDGARNEALDTSVYGEAALRGLVSMGLDLKEEAAEIARRFPRPVVPGPPGSPPVVTPPPPPPRRKGRRRSQSQWLQRGE